MKLTLAKTWLDKHPKWRSEATAQMTVTTLRDLHMLDRKYVRAIQANAMRWAIGKSQKTIENKIQRMLNEC